MGRQSEFAKFIINPPASTPHILKEINGLTFGIELEVDGFTAGTYEDQWFECECGGEYCHGGHWAEVYVEDGTDSPDDFADRLFRGDFAGQLSYTDDCSLDNGVELQFHPRNIFSWTSSEVQEKLRELFYHVRINDLNEGDTAGLHVNIDKDFFDARRLKRLAQLFEKFHNRILDFGNRTSERYCASCGINPKLDTEEFKSQFLRYGRNRVKFQNLALHKYRVAEVRVFQAPNRIETFNHYVQFVAVMAIMSKYKRLNKVSWRHVIAMARRCGFETLADALAGH